ncbi:MAG: HepT-like ribonuclease domain-containing protein [Terriglobia bacterium]
MKDDRIYLRHILECIRRIEEDTRTGRAGFFDSHTLQDAVIRNLQTLSESTQRLPNSLNASRPDIKWSHVGAFRNLLVHNHLGIDLEIVWQIVQEDVPALKRAISAILKTLEDKP